MAAMLDFTTYNDSIKVLHNSLARNMRSDIVNGKQMGITKSKQSAATQKMLHQEQSQNSVNEMHVAYATLKSPCILAYTCLKL